MPAFEEIGSQRSTYYTNWGNRLNVPIIGYNKDKTLNVKIDGCAFKNIGGTLVISSGKLALPEVSSLIFVGSTDGMTRGLASKFWLYRPSAEVCG